MVWERLPYMEVERVARLMEQGAHPRCGHAGTRRDEFGTRSGLDRLSALAVRASSKSGKRIRIQRTSAPETDFGSHTENFDVVVLSDADAKPIWARHYEIETDRPVFAGRDAVKRYALSEIERERRTGTPWYGRWPEELIEHDYPKWQKKLSGLSAKSKP